MFGDNLINNKLGVNNSAADYNQKSQILGTGKTSDIARTADLQDSEVVTGNAFDKAKADTGDVEHAEKPAFVPLPQQLGSGKASEHQEGKHDGFDSECPQCECETCRNRRYKDDSDDATVSFQMPTKMTPTEASSKVKSHEMEHVRHEQHDAAKDGKKVVSQSVQIKTDTCPECGTIYVSGGLTRTHVKEIGSEFYELFRVGGEPKGQSLDERV